MLKALKWFAIILVGGFISLLALGLVIEANKTPAEKAADAARRAAEKEQRAASEEKKRLAAVVELKEQAQADRLAAESSQPEPTGESSSTAPAQGHAQGRAQSLVDRIKSMAADAEWQLTATESPFDGQIYETDKVFESDTYTAQISIRIKCVQAKKALSVTFESHVYDSDGNTLPSSAFGSTWDISGQPFATQGRVKWANQEPQNFTAMLGEYNNVASLDTSKIVEVAGTSGASPSTALASLLPAYFELSNGAGGFTLHIPSGNPSINKVLAACK